MIRFLIIFIFFVFSFADKITIQLNWKYQFEFAGFIMAKEKGIFKKYGLDVELKELDGNNVVKDVENKEGFYGVGGNGLILDVLNGAKIKLLMPIYQHSPYEIVVIGKKLSSIKEIENSHLKLDQFAVKSPMILSMLKANKIDFTKLKISKMKEYDPRKFNNGIYAIYDTNERYFLDKEKKTYTIFNPSDYGFDGYGNILFTSDKEFNLHYDRVKKVIEAVKEGYLYAFSHIPESVDIIYKKYNTFHKSKEALFYEANKLKEKYFNGDFSFDRGRINSIENIYILLGMANKRIDPLEFIYNKFHFTKEELDFIHTHIIKCIMTNNWEPFNLTKDHKIAGIAIDYWDYIKKQTGINSIYEVTNSWTDVLNSIKNKTDDITLATTITGDREKYAIFSIPYEKFPIVIATRNDVGFISDLKLIRDKIIAVGKDYTAEKFIRKYYPDIRIIETKNTEEALRLVSEGKAFAALDILPVIAYKINKYSFSNLKISGKTPFVFNVRMMVRDDYPLLVSIINKVISNMSQEKKDEIYQKWVSVTMQDGYSKEYVNKIYVYIIIGIVIVGFWIFLLVREIIKRKKIEQKLETLATIDRLTSIFNRYKIDLVLEKQVEIGKRYKRTFSLIFFDIDHFKNINDRYGHKSGDFVLKEISRVIALNIRRSDIFGRWGGEEFLIILPETKLENAKILAEKLRKLIEEHRFDGIGRVTCSFGVTEFKESDTNETIMKRVDDLLYKAKNSGRNKIMAG